jgi:hypothetical protein
LCKKLCVLCGFNFTTKNTKKFHKEHNNKLNSSYSLISLNEKSAFFACLKNYRPLREELDELPEDERLPPLSEPLLRDEELSLEELRDGVLDGEELLSGARLTELPEEDEPPPLREGVLFVPDGVASRLPPVFSGAVLLLDGVASLEGVFVVLEGVASLEGVFVVLDGVASLEGVFVVLDGVVALLSLLLAPVLLPLFSTRLLL